PEVFYQFREAVRGMADASEALRIPVLSGNVSFYNETERGEVLPTPVVGVVGIQRGSATPLPSAFPKSRGYIYLLSGHWYPRQQGLGASEYLRIVHGIENGQPDQPDLKSEAALIESLVQISEEGLAACAHDISEGGLAVAIAEMCIPNGVGCHILLDSEEHYVKHILGPVLENMIQKGNAPSEAIYHSLLDEERQHDPWAFSERVDAHLFGETPGRVLLGLPSELCASGAVDRLLEIAAEKGLSLNCIGSFDMAQRVIQFIRPGESLLKISVEEARDAYESALPSLMETR
ncbi:MAG: hypothetical protein D6724_03830, partial [Armatimonadetes bacterium]